MNKELLIANVNFGDIQLEMRWAGDSGDTMDYLVNGRPVPAEVYDRVLATVRTRSLDEISGVLDPDNEHGITDTLDRIHDALNENDDGDHPSSLVDAIKNLTANLPD